MKGLYKTFLSWLPLAVAITGISLLVYATVQQNYRQSFYDPQVQMAESAAYHLGQSELRESVASVIPKVASDYANELTPWLAVFDGSKKLLASSGFQVKQAPEPPSGVFESAKSGIGKDTRQPHENRVTWQPEAGIRQALVVVYVPERDLYVVASRNMREVEYRVENLSLFVLLAWITILIATFVTTAFSRYIS